MVEKRRGLGRGLSALIPETQSEATGRPSDVFFPEGTSRRRATAVSESSNSAGDADVIAEVAAVSSQEHGNSAEITSALLSPAPRKKSSKKRASSKVNTTKSASKKDVSRETSKSVKADENVSRETSVVDQGESKSVSVKETVTTEDVSRETSNGSAVSDTELVAVPGTTFAELPLDLIVANPRQPREIFDEDEISELSASIKEVGLLQPIVVRPAPIAEADSETKHYELIMGERRLRASREAGLQTIPAVIRYTEDEDLLRDALLENLHRVQLNPLEEAAAYQQLLEDFGCTHAELSSRIARSRSQISNTLRLMKLPPLVQRRLAAGVLTTGHARALLGLPDAAAMERLAQRIVSEGLSVRNTEELVALHDEPETPVRSYRPRSTPMPALASQLSDAFDTRVKVTRGAKKGRIMIEFAGQDDLERIIEALAPGVSLESD